MPSIAIKRRRRGPTAGGVLAGGGVTPWYEIVTPFAAWQAKNAASYVASLVNLVNPGINDLTEAVGSPSWTKENGWEADNTNYFLTGINISETEVAAGSLIVAAKNSGGRSFFMAGSAAPALWGVRDQAGSLIFIWPRDSYTQAYTAANENVMAVVANLAYLNGSLVDTMGSPGLLTSSELAIMAYNDGSQIMISGNVYAAAYYDTLLTQPQVLAIGTAMLNP